MPVYYEMFKLARLYVRNIPAPAKSQYYNDKIKECNGYQKTVLAWLARFCTEIKQLNEQILTVPKTRHSILIIASVSR